MNDVKAWTPQGIAGLEPRVEAVVRGRENCLVVAGPGAGKTELLAQRACFLLQTGACVFPARILALCFKRDAAKNLANRVAARCSVDAARRFESYTYHAFAKHLLDRFLPAVPKVWRPKADYSIESYYPRDFRQFLNELNPESAIASFAQIDQIDERFFTHNIFCSVRALGEVPEADPVSHWAASAIWMRLLRNSDRSILTFPMITVLATLLLQHNQQILTALRATYSHVFLDEFQDTTKDQFELIESAFAGTGTCATAVGDNKQRIMLWAGALGNSFDAFSSSFGACLVRPVMNYRSAPELVRIQSYLMEALDPSSEPPVAWDQGDEGAGSCEVLVFPDQSEEADHLAREILGWIQAERIGPRQICILVKRNADVYAAPLIAALRGRVQFP